MADRVNRDRFIKLLTERFPEVAAAVDDCSSGLLHLEMATLARATQVAIDNQDRDTVRRHFQFIDQVFLNAAAGACAGLWGAYLDLRFKHLAPSVAAFNCSGRA